MITFLRFIMWYIQEEYYYYKFKIIQKVPFLQVWVYDRDNRRADKEWKRLKGSGARLED